MTREMDYNVGGGCGSTIIFGFTKDGDSYADLGGDAYENEDLRETFTKDYGRTLDGIRDDLNKLEDDEDLDDDDLDDDEEDDDDLDDDDWDDDLDDDLDDEEDTERE